MRERRLNTLFDGRYMIERLLWSGAVAHVYLAKDMMLGRAVAIKIVDDRYASEEQFERFRSAARVAGGLSHPNIVALFDHGAAEGTYYILMEYVDGQSLDELVRRRGPVPPSTVVGYTRQILRGIRYAHAAGVIHGGLKPRNVLVAREGLLRLTDFGFSTATAALPTGPDSTSGAGLPEPAVAPVADRCSDIYSIGLVMYEMVTGAVAPPRPLQLRPDILRDAQPRDVDLIVMRALAKDAADRYQNAEEFDADLERVSNAPPVDG